jgi:hypothetical protein
MGSSYLATGIQGFMGFQATMVIQDQSAVGMQSLASTSSTNNSGMQAELNIVDHTQALGMEAKQDTLSHVTHGKYLNEPYMSEAYMAEKMCAFLGMQAEITINTTDPNGMQSLMQIVDQENAVGMQTAAQVTDELNPVGMQALSIQAFIMGMQARISIYNATNVRIMCEFASRGITTTNWTASSTEPGDFDVNNLDSDIQEEIWRSATGVVTGITLDTDTGLPQGIFVDTIAILNHNISSSGTVTVLGADDAAFTTIGTTIPMQRTDDNMYYIAPALPTVGHRYWRFVIDDATNPDGFVSVGIILMGTADIFQGECLTDSIRFQHNDFADKIETEGFTNVANSRALKKSIGLEFRSLRFQDRNFRILRDIFTTYRTTHKCLWIPTPSATDMEVTGRFAVFGKISALPSEQHNSKGPTEDYVDLTLDIDESL